MAAAEPFINPHHLVRKTAQAAPFYLASDGVYAYIGKQLVERLHDTTRTFGSCVEFGSGYRSLQALLKTHFPAIAYTTVDICPATQPTVVANVEDVAPIFAAPQFDLALLNMLLPFVGNPHQCLLQAGKALKGDGLLLASTIGAASFPELKQAFAAAGSGHTHAAPQGDVRSYGDLLQTLQFALPVVDSFTQTFYYPSFAHILGDLKFTASTNLWQGRAKGLFTPRFMARVEAEYIRLFAGTDGLLPLTLELVFLAGWRPHHSQPKPLKPGSARIHFSDVM